jgi:hypothetical protein
MSGLSITTLSASVARRSGIAPMKRRCSMRTMAALCLCAASSVFGVACSSDDPTGDGLPTGIHRFSWDEVAQKPRGPLPHFSFFVTTQRGLFSLGAGRWAPAPDPVLGYGGDLGGIAGADEICSRLAQKANPGIRRSGTPSSARRVHSGARARMRSIASAAGHGTISRGASCPTTSLD